MARTPILKIAPGSSTTYTVPAGKYAILNFLCKDSSSITVGASAFFYSSSGNSNQFAGFVAPAGTTIGLNAGTGSVVVATGFEYDL